MDARDTEPGLSSRGVTFAAHSFAAWTRADPEVVWTALTDPGQTPRFLYGLGAHSTWIPGASIDFRCGEDVQVSGRVLCVQRGERLSYVLQSASADPPVYLTWTIRVGTGRVHDPPADRRDRRGRLPPGGGRYLAARPGGPATAGESGLVT